MSFLQSLFWPVSRPRPGWWVKHYVRGAGGIASAQAFGTPSAGTGPIGLVLTGIASAQAFGSHIVEVDRDLFPFGIGAPNLFGTATVSLSIAPSGLPSGEGFGSAELSTHLIMTVGAGPGTGEAVGDPVVTTLNVAAPAGVESEQNVPAPTLLLGTVTVTVAGVDSGEAFGAVAVVYAQAVTVTGIGSAEAFGDYAVSNNEFELIVSGIASVEAFGTPALHLHVSTTSIGGAEAFGTAVVTTGVVGIAPTGIGSAEAVSTGGALSYVVTFTGIGSGEVFGTAQLNQFITASGIASGEGFGSATAGVGAVTIAVNGIASGEAFGTTVVIWPPIDGGDASVTGSFVFDGGQATAAGSFVIDGGSA